MAKSNEEPLRILCIHGYRQSGQAFRERTGAFRKIVKKQADLVFINAPNIVPPFENAEGDSVNAADQRGWWFSREDDYFLAKERSDCCKGYEESLEVIKTAFEEQGPFDGVLGFSQGGSMVSLLCGLREQNPDSPFKFDFAILVASFQSRSSQHDILYSKPITLPTLHVFGDTDKVIQKEMSEELLPHFVNPITLQHPGGHFIPASGPQKKVYLEFLKDMMARKISS
ncbi:esterase OVCA2-like [Lineus longissimus]|uniref:esterase OVCA2-like n=1 Tax=Lineus longissimus TaxID=88925 RepID=UPI002B4C83C5